LPSLGVRSAIALVSMLLFLHLGFYAIAFHADDICTSTSVGEWLRHYAALVSFAMLYGGGSIILFMLVILLLRRRLLIDQARARSS
jgi:hypothetical protein